MSWEDLAAALEVHVRTIERWRKKRGAPQLPDVAAWREWRGKPENGHETVADDAALPGDCNYDDLVKEGKITYALAKIREQVISEQVANDQRRTELAKLRGSLVTKDDAEKAAALVRDAVTRKYDQAIARAIQSLPVEIRSEVGRAIETELDRK